MKAKSLIITVALLGLISLLGGCSRYGGVDNPTGPSTVSPKVFMDPPTKNTFRNEQFIITVYIENASNLFFAAFDIVYDPTKVSLPDGNWAEGSFLKQDGADIELFVSGEQPISGTNLVKRNIGISRIGSNTGISGERGVLCSFTFKALTTGTTTIDFNRDPSTLGFMGIDASRQQYPIEITVDHGTTVNIN